MTAGKPNYQKLFDMGKLPEEMRYMIPGLEAADRAKEKLSKLETVLCDSCKAKLAKIEGEAVPKPVPQSEPKSGATEEDPKPGATEEDPKPGATIGDSFTAKCEVEGCGKEFTDTSQGKANNKVRMHARSHK